MRTGKGWAAAAVAATLLPASTLTAAAAPAAVAATGCHLDWPVIVHHGSGQRIQLPTGTSLPVACATETGHETSESSVAVTNTGAIFYSPAQSENSMARSLDGGASWSLVQPPVMQYTALWNTVDPYVIVDRRTGRIFWVHVTGPTRTTPLLVSNSPLPPSISTGIAFAYGFQVYSTADDGRTWTTADYSTAPMTDWEKIFSGPPRPASTGAPQPAGYPDVVYVCANSPFEVAGPGRLCYRSLDGGVSFSPAGYIVSPTTPAACPALNSNTGVVDSTGTVYQPMTCTNRAYVAVSRDEGSTYALLPVAGAPAMVGIGGGAVQLAIDDADHLFAMWLAKDAIDVVVSRDHGHTWSSPLAVAAPAVHGIADPVIAAGPPGHVAITYYGSPDPAAAWLNAYVTETADALDPEPVFYSGMLNDPAHPVVQSNETGFSGGTPRIDYVGGSYDSSGTFWAGLVKAKGPTPTGNAYRPTTGYVGRLLFRAASNVDATRVASAPAPPGIGVPSTSAWQGSTPLGTVLATLAALVGSMRRRRGHRPPAENVRPWTSSGSTSPT